MLRLLWVCGPHTLTPSMRPLIFPAFIHPSTPEKATIMERTPFYYCPMCRAKYPRTDLHQVCNFCLSPDHQEASCSMCLIFGNKKHFLYHRDRASLHPLAHYCSEDTLDLFREQETEGELQPEACNAEAQELGMEEDSGSDVKAVEAPPAQRRRSKKPHHSTSYPSTPSGSRAPPLRGWSIELTSQATHEASGPPLPQGHGQH